jgi:hypothetical protein
MIPQIAGLTDDGIRDYVDNLKYQNSVSIMWDDIAKSDHGSFIEAQLKHELEFWRSQYSQIDAGSPQASNLLSFIQGIELFATRLLNRVKTSGIQTEANMKEIEVINEMLLLREKQKIGHTLLPVGYVKKEKQK